MAVPNHEDYDFEIPDFVNKRAEHLRRVEEEQRLMELERKRRLALQRQAKIKRIREQKRRRQRAIKLTIGGITVVVLSSILINNLIGGVKGNQVEHNVDTSYTIVQIQEGDDLLPVEEQYVVDETVLETAPEEVVIKIDMSYDARMANVDTNGTFKVGSELNEYVLNKLSNNSEVVNYLIKYGEMYGVDPYILIAKAMQESSFSHNACLPGGKNYNGYGMGIMQHESPDGRKITAFNYETGQEEVAYVTWDNAADLEMNIKMGAMHFQNCLNKNNGNILLALQSYNYGQGMIESILRAYGKEIGMDPEEIKSNYEDIGWMKYVKDAHNNAWKYVRGWEGYYGDANYIKNVLRYFVGNEACYYYDGEQVLFDLNTFEMTKLTENTEIIMK